MPYAEFTPSNLGIQWQDAQTNAAATYGNLFQRAQQLQMDQAQLPGRMQLVASQVALADQEAQKAALDYKIEQVSSVPAMLAQQAATRMAQLKSQQAQAQVESQTQGQISQLMQQMPADLDRVFGSGSSQGPGQPGSGMPQNQGAGFPGSSPQYAQPAPPDAATAGVDIPPGLDIASHNAQLGNIAYLEAKYAPVLAQNPTLVSTLRAQTQGLKMGFEVNLMHTVAPQILANIAKAGSTDQLRQIAGSPTFQYAAAAMPQMGLQTAWDKSLATVQAQEQQAREFENQKAQRAQEFTNQQALKQQDFERTNTVDAAGYTGVAQGTSEGAQKFRESATAYQDVAGIVGQLQQLADKYRGVGFDNVAGPDKATAQSLSTLLQAHLAKGLFNRTTENELGLLSGNVAPDVSTLLSRVDSNKAKLNTILQVEAASLDHQARSLGLKKTGAGAAGPNSNGGAGIQAGGTL